MEGHCSTGQSPQWAVVPMEEEEVMSAKAAVVTSKRQKRHQVVSHVPRHFPSDPERKSGELGRGAHATILAVAGLGFTGESIITPVRSTMP